tara:strand:+ start:222 stop:461 length:240 start_codon:yes stop_codon:yes gene_type:complete
MSGFGKVMQYDEATGTFKEMTDAEVKTWREEAERERQKRIAEKGHDCEDHRVHETYDRGNGGVGDSYVCSVCGEILQVG